jgi:hypothetical protein
MTNVVRVQNSSALSIRTGTAHNEIYLEGGSKVEVLGTPGSSTKLVMMNGSELAGSYSGASTDIDASDQATQKLSLTMGTGGHLISLANDMAAIRIDAFQRMSTTKVQHISALPETTISLNMQVRESDLLVRYVGNVDAKSIDVVDKIRVNRIDYRPTVADNASLSAVEYLGSPKGLTVAQLVQAMASLNTKGSTGNEIFQGAQYFSMSDVRAAVPIVPFS